VQDRDTVTAVQTILIYKDKWPTNWAIPLTLSDYKGHFKYYKRFLY